MKAPRILFLIIILLIKYPASLIAKSDDIQTQTARRQLFDLLEERKMVFDKYNETLKQKSGIFGNRTKNDMRESHEQLQGIIEIDNRVISSLNHVIDMRNFEKSSMNFDASSYLDRISNLTRINDITLKENARLLVQNKYLGRQNFKMKFYFLLLFGIIGYLLFIRYKDRKALNAKIK